VTNASQSLKHGLGCVLVVTCPQLGNVLVSQLLTFSQGRGIGYRPYAPTNLRLQPLGHLARIDLNVLNVLVRKARDIRRRLGISVAPPVESEQVIQALIENVLLRQQGGTQLALDLSVLEVSALHKEWDEAEEREAKGRTCFAQASIQPDEIKRELLEMEPALGNAHDIQSFVVNGIQRFDGEFRTTRQSGGFDLHPGSLERNITERRRTPKSWSPRTWRTRPDSFEAVWDAIVQWLVVQPKLTARLILDRLHTEYPGEYLNSLLRTLQRRVKQWRASVLLQFDDAWLGEEVLAGVNLPPPLHATVDVATITAGKILT